ncbi:MAG: hypothetical protein IJ877_02235 [Candidatus Gastranaerophilales bacterium]|nr:hypothetical protein [Candidatus Gastranaerophilales bacterium]
MTFFNAATDVIRTTIGTVQNDTVGKENKITDNQTDEVAKEFRTSSAVTETITPSAPSGLDLTGLGVPAEVANGSPEELLDWFIHNGALDEDELQLYLSGVPLDVIFAGELE